MISGFYQKKGVTLDVSFVNKKLKIYGLKFNYKSFMEKVDEKRGMWKGDLQDLVIGALPDFNNIVNDLETWCRTWV